jgi:glycosyltransferase involved in cell wall biosynthesis
MRDSRIAILIPTRNRPIHITNLLQSVAESMLKPEEIIVISSGNDISAEIARFGNLLPISHTHIEGRGQILQKKIGIQMISDQIDWVLFLDDDLLLQRESLGMLAATLNNLKNEYIGVGLNLVVDPSKQKTENGGLFWKARSLINLYAPGQISRGGQNINYMQSKVRLETQWLNGASAWRAQVAKLYNAPLLTGKYAVYEDVLFSTSMRKHGKLMFIPNITLEHQNISADDVSTPNIFFSSSFWRLYFVRTNKECNRFSFFLHQIRLSISFLVRNKEKKLKQTALCISVLKVFFLLVNFSLSYRKPEEIVKFIEENEEIYS